MKRKAESTNRRAPSGMGSVSQRADGRWWARISLDDGSRKAIYGRTEEEVTGKLITALAERQRGTLITGRVPTLREFIARWLTDVAKPGVKASTHRRYCFLFDKHILPGLGKVRLSKLTPQHVQRLYRDKLAQGLAPSHVHHIHRGLHVALKTAVRWGFVSRNVCDLVDPPRVPKQPYQVFTPEQAKRFLTVIQGDHLAAYYILSLTTGMRAGELRGLRWEDVDLEAGMIVVRRSVARVSGIGWVEDEPKTRSGWRTIPLIQPAVAALRAHRIRQAEMRLAMGPQWEDLGRVFTNGYGRPLEHQNVARRSFQPLLEKAGLPKMRIHDLRHSTATLLKALGVDLKTISTILGHSNISITADIYTHTLTDTTREAVGRLNSLFEIAE